jgi:hypothetical protein
MAFTFDTIVIDAVNYDSLCTRAEANEYLAPELNLKAWDTATDANKDKALVSATRILVAQNWIDESAVPDAVLIAANSLMADQLLAGETPGSGQSINSVSAGSVSIDFEGSTSVGASKFDSRITALIGQYLTSSYSTNANPYFSGTDEDDYPIVDIFPEISEGNA